MATMFDKSPNHKAFEKALLSVAYTQSHWTVFNDFLDFSLLMLKWHDCKPEYFAELEKRYTKKKEHEAFAEAYYQMSEMAHDFADPFGNYFMEYFSSDHAGQFFTPEHICDFMTAVLAPEELEDGKTICDPCCGSGRFLLAAGKRNRKLKFYGADIDITCVKMTLINMILQSMPGEVAHMDSLRLDIWKVYKVTLLPYGDHVVPMYMEIQPHQSIFYSPPVPKAAPKPLPDFKTPPAGKAVQTSLF